MYHFKTFISIILFLFFIVLNDLSSKNYISDSLNLSDVHKLGPEVNRINFYGIEKFTSSELLSIIESRTSYNGIVNSIMLMYYREGKKSTVAPKLIMDVLKKNIDWFSNELRIFDNDIVNEDLKRIEIFYNKNGYHDVKVNFRFEQIPYTNGNQLSFYIHEGPRYKLSHLKYENLDLIPEDIQKRINNIITINPGDYFEEETIYQNLVNIQSILLDNGYYFAKYNTPRVYTDSTNKTDSVHVVFETGSRMKISSIKIEEIRNNQPVVSKSTKERQISFKKGDWYNKTDEIQTRVNLLSLGTFDNVNISYTSYEDHDSLLECKIVLAYNKQKDWEISVGFNETVYNKTTNLNVGGNLVDRNMFYGSQTAKVYADYTIIDISRTINLIGSQGFSEALELTDFQLRTGLNFSDPFLFRLSNWSVGGYVNPSYSRRSLAKFADTIDPLILNTFSIPIGLNFRLPYYTFFQNFYLDLILRREKPENFTTLDESPDNTQFLRFFLLYSQLNEYDKSFFTTTALKLSTVTDRRNHPFNPTAGYLINASIEFTPIGALVVSLYNRLELRTSHYLSISDNLTFASRFNIGHIFFPDKSSNFIAPEKQFFAGGANSIRGWESRKLRFDAVSRDSIGSNSVYNFLEDFVGNTSLIETGFEFRYQFDRPEYFDDFWADQIASLGLVGFLDIGNAYNWMIEDYSSEKYRNFFGTLAVAIGAGIRYNTPVGPLRLDFAWPLLDPNEIFEPLTNMKFHIGIGHAF